MSQVVIIKLPKGAPGPNGFDLVPVRETRSGDYYRKIVQGYIDGVSPEIASEITASRGMSNRQPSGGGQTMTAASSATGNPYQALVPRKP